MALADQAADAHALPAEAMLARLGTGPAGLSDHEAAARRARFGPNRLPGRPTRSFAARLWAQLDNLLIWILAVAAFVSLLLDHPIDAAVIFAVILVNSGLGLVQEGRAERALDAIRAMIDPKAAVLRDGRRVTVPADAIVPGDLVLIEAGDRVPADLRLLKARNLKIEEAVLTGESLAVDKDTQAVTADAPLGDRGGMAFSGTFVAAGQGTGIAVATGGATELGRISAMVGAVEVLETPLTRQVRGFARQLTFIVLGIAGLAFALALFARGYALGDAFMLMVGLAVAAIPEGLPAIMTITLAIGVQRMAVRNAIVRRLPAVETLGSVSIICSDKTGTLTRNEMTVTTLVTSEGETAVAGVGYAPVPPLALAGAARDLARIGLFCNDAELRATGGRWVPDGDPMEGALIALAMKAGLDPAMERAAAPRADEIPFDAVHRFMATLHRGPEAPFVALKGAPERLIALCRFEAGPDGRRPIDRARWHAEADRLAARGQRLLAFARGPAAAARLDFATLEAAELELVGLAGFIDPPRAEARQAIGDCRAAGIRVAMITGDHAITAREIAAELGLAEQPRVLTGAELDRLDDAALEAAVRETSVFARTSPAHKLRLVAALQAQGLTVAMTGDGVNDAPALKRADIGIAMGQKGTEASKEAAEMVLADDNFASIVAAVREGRTVYDNLRKAIAFLLPVNGGESLSLLLAVLFGVPLPIEPLQILWVNMISSVALGTVLAFEPTEPDVMTRRPRAPDEALLSRFVVWRVALLSALFMTGIFGAFGLVQALGGSLESARTAAVNTLVVMEIFYLFSVRYLRTPSFTFRGVQGTPRVLAAIGAVAVLQLALTCAPPLNTVFRTAPLGLMVGAIVLATGPVLLLLLEVEKAVRRRRR